MWTSKEIKKQGLASIENCFFRAWFSVFLCRVAYDLPALFWGSGADILRISPGEAASTTR